MNIDKKKSGLEDFHILISWIEYWRVGRGIFAIILLSFLHTSDVYVLVEEIINFAFCEGKEKF